ncbi:PTS sugar transporter subunit IIB [Solidesulfovibrio carbinolicus]|uniref:PTS mannose/fructose/sorbose transporter subunit IIB n=1 Tax=Solidesulfovibrio carbinolicus TaxID=296842 RepID=A0A4P6HP81_9BACT|nr:PTS sugar transporter subunit IIB [Solidesulfovibrio carbinolicus]QAZ67890.1 PTS mannose/fructose/sorbose transporter subunit IIB [Solidesulfovibrio carbinolicus]
MAFVRIDNRLVHGQIIETWLPFTHASRIVVVNDDLAADHLRQEIMSLAIPDGVAIVFLPVADLAGYFSHAPLDLPEALILFASCRDAQVAYEYGFDFANLNLGNLHYAPGKRQVCPHVALSKEDESCLDFFRDKGVRLDYRCVPGDPAQPRI